MTKHWIICLLVIVPAWICVAAAQNSHVKSSQVKSSSTKSSATSHTTAIKPLTPKTAMPAPHKSSVVVPKASRSSANTSAALTHIEQQNSKPSGVKSGAAPAPKAATAPKSAGSGSEINFQYQKPKTNTTNPTKRN